MHKANTSNPHLSVKNKNKHRGPELLAPAGSLESFHAAVEAGADALYLGLNDFNARLRAKNFSIKTLSYLIPFAHRKNLKIYITLNTLVKQNELKNIINMLYQLEQIGTDAIIIQDLGIAYIARYYFPKLTLHASTQMVIHNSIGVRAAELLDFKRVILSRECSLSEIKAIQKSTSLELEVFIHGALCYSISGLCLASSYLGGLSGNRGRCTQVCRRRFTTTDTSGFYFSSKDLCALDFIKSLTDVGIASIKIEGRMKSADYIYKVVSAYRKFLDNSAPLDTIRNELCHDFGREKSHFFLESTNEKEIINESRPPGTGILLGPVISVYKEYIEIKSDEKLAAGDKIRINTPDKAEGFTGKITNLSQTSEHYQVYVNKASETRIGDLVYLVSTKVTSQKKWSKKHIDTEPAKYHTQCPYSTRILKNIQHFNKRTPVKGKENLYIRIDTVKWLPLLTQGSYDGIILNLIDNEFQHLKSNQRLFKQWSQKLIIALPPFIPQDDIPLWEKNITALQKLGINKWLCSHISQKEIIHHTNILYSDSPVWTTNKATQKLLIKHGYARFSYSPEDDILNLKATGNPNGIMTLFAYIPLFISRIKPSLAENTVLIDDNSCGFFYKKQNGLYYLIGEKPLCLTHRRDKLKAAGIYNYILDLRFCPVQKRILKTVFSYYRKQEKIPDTTLFNHKAGLK